jgi:hypothetical protein
MILYVLMPTFPLVKGDAVKAHTGEGYIFSECHSFFPFLPPLRVRSIDVWEISKVGKWGAMF